MASSAFARHYLRNHGCFLFLWVLRCFTSPRSLLLPYVFRQRSPDITPVSFEVSLFGDPRIEARLPAPRGLSQVTTSFIGSWCLGIHRLPLVACCYYKDARVHCEVLNIRAGSPAVCASPELFAAYRGLPRLRVPRHPPHAFARLTTSSLRRRPSRARADPPG